MIVIYHQETNRPVVKGFHNHDQAAFALHAMSEQRIISTQRLAIADESELSYGTYKTINHDQRPHRGRRKGSKNANRG